jgi:hypothetical protein
MFPLRTEDTFLDVSWEKTVYPKPESRVRVCDGAGWKKFVFHAAMRFRSRPRQETAEKYMVSAECAWGEAPA